MRCKACDAELGKYEVIWRKDIQQYEDLCRKCRRAISTLCTSPLHEGGQYISIPNIRYFDDEYEEDYDYE